MAAIVHREGGRWTDNNERVQAVKHLNVHADVALRTRRTRQLPAGQANVLWATISNTRWPLNQQPTPIPGAASKAWPHLPRAWPLTARAGGHRRRLLAACACWQRAQCAQRRALCQAQQRGFFTVGQGDGRVRVGPGWPSGKREVPTNFGVPRRTSEAVGAEAATCTLPCLASSPQPCCTLSACPSLPLPCPGAGGRRGGGRGTHEAPARRRGRARARCSPQEQEGCGCQEGCGWQEGQAAAAPAELASHQRARQRQRGSRERAHRGRAAAAAGGGQRERASGGGERAGAFPPWPAL